jgi:hypothetical protein
VQTRTFVSGSDTNALSPHARHSEAIARDAGERRIAAEGREWGFDSSREGQFLAPICYGPSPPT